ncbi:uncharacterized protein LOC116264799 [Nymphaea colorata]|uniref:uncharacterized protein LOC116264799 n=1 Tax=Nymphaea colorata TaxID=210225 RepID=UPI00129E1513|nr:uncharacterized protein LOC116264799 [Nymphaea colorata]XP_031501064.1 uncharacterized protein LOC116264799 [Nymphaea colorata]XP_031501065.1 uncharacterized protein LOC116264799 [Nymphaea colorata]XP_049936614.1 uncharacterized protein LOC116264799 [Nymphaea colorata]
MSDGTEEVEIMNARIENVKNQAHKEPSNGHELWVDGLLCAFEYIRPRGKANYTKSGSKMHLIKHPRSQELDNQNQQPAACDDGPIEKDESAYNYVQELDEINQQSAAYRYALFEGSEGTNEYVWRNSQAIGNVSDNHWVPIGWERISELVRSVQVDQDRFTRTIDMSAEDEDLTVADIAAPYWEKPAGPTWWCHVIPTHPNVDSWLRNAQWLHPAISTALRDESRLISERMKHLYYEVPVRVAGGLLFELLGQSVGDPFSYEDDIPIVLRSWQAQNFLLTALHVKGVSSHINVLGITEVQDLLLAGGTKSPKSAHELIACLASRLTRWDDRLFRKYIFGASDEVELKFVNRRNNEDLNLMSMILNQEIRRLATQVIRVKWSLHAREEIIFELLQLLRGYATKVVLEEIRKSTRAMIEEQEAVRARLFTIQDVMQSNVRAWLQDKSIRITHNLAVFGGCGLVLSIITGLFGVNLDGIPGGSSTPYAFGLFSAIVFLTGAILIGLGMLYLGLRRPVTEEEINVRKLELQDLVKAFQHDAEAHAKVRQEPNSTSRHHLPPTAADLLPHDADYILIEQ